MVLTRTFRRFSPLVYRQIRPVSYTGRIDIIEVAVEVDDATNKCTKINFHISAAGPSIANSKLDSEHWVLGKTTDEITAYCQKKLGEKALKAERHSYEVVLQAITEGKQAS